MSDPTPEQLAAIPDRLLRRDRDRRAHGLVGWLAGHGLSLSLLELEAERKRRGLETTERTTNPRRNPAAPHREERNPT